MEVLNAMMPYVEIVAVYVMWRSIGWGLNKTKKY